jgi:hypothetical protein
MTDNMIDTKAKAGPIIFYCKDCEKVVDTEQFGRKYVYKCKKCGTKNVAFGTEKSIFSFFRLDAKKVEKDGKPDKDDVKKAPVVDAVKKEEKAESDLDD